MSRNRSARAAERLPPALSPAIATFDSGTPNVAALAIAQRVTVSQSSRPAGNGFSGASRYPTEITTAPDALHNWRATLSMMLMLPITMPPPWK